MARIVVVQAPRHLEHLAGRKSFQVPIFELLQGPKGLDGSVKKPPKQGPFRRLPMPKPRDFAGCDRGSACRRGFTDFRADDIFRNTSLVRNPIRELIAGDNVRDIGRYRQHA